MTVSYNPSTGKLERVRSTSITDDRPDRDNPNYYPPEERAAIVSVAPEDIAPEVLATEERAPEDNAIDYDNYSGKEERIRINGDLLTIDKVCDYGGLPLIETSDGNEYYLASSGACDGLAECTIEIGCAGCAAETYYRELAEHDPSEFECMIGRDNLVALALGQSAAPGSVSVRSLNEWFELNATVPEEQFASYDGSELDVDRYGTIADEIGFVPTVAYRHN